MLQRFLLITLTLCSLSATAQWQQTGSKVRYVNGLGIPTKDTAAGVAADSSQILIRPADSALYIKYKRTWLRVGGGGGSIAGGGAAGQVSFFTGASAISGDSALFWDNTNKRLGIHTTNPGKNLDVHGTNVIAQFNGTGTNNAYLDFQRAGSTQWRIGNQYAAAVNRFSIFNAAGTTETFSILQNGNVGISIINPVTKLDVNGSVRAYGVIVAQASGTETGYLFNALSFGYDTTNNYGWITSGGAAARNNLALQIGGGNVGVGNAATNAKLEVNASSGEVFRADASGGAYRIVADQTQVLLNGKVGINQTSPIYQLHVTSGGSAVVFTDAGTSAVIAGTNANATASALLSLRGDILTMTGGGINASEHVRINGSGNVGINNTTPNEKLSIVQPILTSYPTLGTASGGISLLGDSKLYGLYTGINTVDGNAWMQVMRNNAATAYNLLLQPVGGNVGIGYTAPAAKLAVSGTALINTNTDNGLGDKLQVNGSILSTQFKLSALNTAPSSAGDTGTLGEIRIDANYIYICTATNTWKRVAIATW